MFKIGLLRSSKPPVPVIVVGNITVGGNGKTPVVIAICEYLLAKGKSVGVLSRGYGGTQTVFPYQLVEGDLPSLVGDEPALIFQRLGIPVIIDPQRRRGAERLFELGCDVIVCDDGLQHYALQRDIEWVVMDDRGAGNGWLLPAGPLRELPNRLAGVDGVILNQTSAISRVSARQFDMKLGAGQIVNVADPSLTISIDKFKQKYSRVQSMCAIGNPDRFKTTLASLGINPVENLAFIDHYQYEVTDLPDDAVIMTEKDAVKCHSFAHKDCWFLRVSAQLPEAFFEHLAASLATVNSTE